MLREAPRDLNIDVTRKSLYDELQVDWSPFASSKRRYMKDIFLYAAILGYVLKRSTKLKKKDARIPLSGFKDEERWILKSMIINKEGLDILHKEKELYSMVEEYANGGLDELHKIIYESQIDPELGLEEVIRSYLTVEMIEKFKEMQD